MKITIDVSDFYLEEGNIEKDLKAQITFEVVSQIKKSIQEKVDKQITMEVKDIVEKMLYKEITKAITETVKKEEIPSRKISNTKVNIETYVRECLESTGGWQSFSDTIKKIAADYTVELKKRYDLLFASQIVAKMSDSGLLKEDAVRLLLGTEK